MHFSFTCMYTTLSKVEEKAGITGGLVLRIIRGFGGNKGIE